MGLDGLLLVLFIVLKLTGAIAWSWFWVISPVWIGVILYYIISLFGKSEFNK